MRAGLLVGSLLLALAFGARAQASPASDAASTEDRTEEAKGLFSAGKAAFDAGRYADALAYFQRSYAISGRPALLYNIGVAADHARGDEQALDAYERYLTQVPDAENHEEVQNRVAALREALERRRAAAALPPTASQPPPPAAPAPAPAPETSAASAPPVAESSLVVEAPPAQSNAPTDSGAPSPLQWAVLGTSGALVIGGGVLLALALSDKSKVESAPVGTSLQDIESAHDRVPTFSALGGVLLGVGIAGAAASVAWIVMDDEEASESSATLRLGPGGVLLAGAFR